MECQIELEKAREFAICANRIQSALRTSFSLSSREIYYAGAAFDRFCQQLGRLVAVITAGYPWAKLRNNRMIAAEARRLGILAKRARKRGK